MHGHPAEYSLPRLVEKDGRFALLVDDAPFLILGAQVNNSSAWPALLPKVRPVMDALHVNTAEIPVYGEQMEPQPGQFDFSLMDTLLIQPRFQMSAQERRSACRSSVMASRATYVVG